MRDDAICFFVAGAGGFSGGGFFGPSKLSVPRDQFVKAYPDVPILPMDWNTAGRITEKMRGRKCVAKVHSFGAHRFIHELFEADQCWDVMEVIIDDAVRYTHSDELDLDAIASNPFEQEFNRTPIPVPSGVGCAYSFLREGGQNFRHILNRLRSLSVARYTRTRLLRDSITTTCRSLAHRSTCSRRNVLRSLARKR